MIIMKSVHKLLQSILPCLFIFVSLISNLNYAKCEWFSSLGQMEDLVHDELDLLSSLREYINAEEVKLKKIKRCNITISYSKLALLLCGPSYVKLDTF